MRPNLVFDRESIEKRVEGAKNRALPVTGHPTITIAKRMDEDHFKVKDARKDQGVDILLMGLEPVEQIVHQGGNSFGGRGHVADKIYHVPNVYVRFDDPDKGVLIKGFNITPIYPFQLSKERYISLRNASEKK